MTAEQPAPHPSGMPCRLAVVGVGHWGRRIIATLLETEVAQLIAVASSQTATHELAPPGVDIVADWRALLGRSDLDGVVVATPPATHAEIVEAAVRAGLGVLVEKPLTPDLATTTALAERVSGERVLVDHIHLFHAAYEVLREQLAGQSILGVRTEGGAPGPLKDDPSPLWEYGPHDAALVLDLLGEVRPTSVRVGQLPIPDGTGEEWTIEARGGLDEGIPVQIVTGNGLAEKQRRLLVATAEVRYLLDDRAATKLLRFPPGPLDWPGPGGESVPISDIRLPLERVLSAFAGGLTAGETDGRWGWRLPLQVADLLTSVERHR